MRMITIQLKNLKYKILVGSFITKHLGKYLAALNLGQDAYIITNKAIHRRYNRMLNATLTESGFATQFALIPDTERSKSLRMASVIIDRLARFDKNKRVFIVAFGGGVVGDLSAFVASIYKRGIPYIQIPTTLLAQIDSSIGGKTAVDLETAKNLVGTFYQPKLVFTDTQFLKTIDTRQIRSGLSEVIKYAIIKDRPLFNFLESNFRDIFALKQPVLNFVIGRCCRIKANIVDEDEREKRGIRIILNFGHTIGHALEAAARFKGYTHGEAIALGMLIAADVSEELKLITPRIKNRIESLIRAVGLPSRIKNLDLKDIIRAHYRDKKFIGSRNRFVLIEGIGKTRIVENIPLELIEEAVKRRLTG